MSHFHRPMSATLLAFAEPLLALAPRSVVAPHMQAVLSLAQQLWNAPSSPLAPPPSRRAIADVARALGVPVARVEAALGRLEADRRTRFSGDNRTFVHLAVTHHAGEVSVRVEGLADAEPPTAPTGLGRDERRVLAGLIDAEFPTSALMISRTVFSRQAPAALLEAFLDDAGEALRPQLFWRFAAALAYWAGAAAAAEAVSEALRAARPAHAMPLLNMLSALGADGAVASLPRSMLEQQAEGMWRAMGRDPDRLTGLLLGLWCTPGPARKVLAEALLARSPRQDLSDLAVAGALSPFAPEVREVFLRAVAALKSPEARAFLATLGPETLGPALYATARRLVMRLGEPAAPGAPLAGSPLEWPTLAAYATYPDTVGSQALYLVRRRASGAFMFFGGVVNDARGLVDDMVRPALTGEALDELLERLPATVVEVEVAYAVARLQAAEATSARQGYPLPLEYLAGRYLLAGTSPEGAPDLRAEAEARFAPDLLPHTGAVLHTRALRHWAIAPSEEAARGFYAELDAALAGARRARGVPEAFPAGLMAELDAPFALGVAASRLKAIDAAADRAREAVWTPEACALWAERLRQAMWLFKHEGREHLASAAATAAVALDRGALDGLGFVRTVMRRSAGLGLPG